MKNTKTEIKGNNIILRKLKLSDYKSIYNSLQDKDIAKYTENIPWPYRKTDAIKFIIKSKHSEKKKQEYVFGITLKNTCNIIGIVHIFNIDLKNKNAEIGYWLGKKHWRKGIATEAVGLILKFAFEDLKLHKIQAKLFEENIASKRVLEKTGFKLEAIMKEQLYRNNKYHNELKFGILMQDYKNRQNK